MITPYPHQMEFINGIRAEMRVHKYVVGQAFTGFGKSYCASYIIDNALKKGSRVFFTIHLKELKRQTALSFTAAGIDYGFIASGEKTDYSKMCQLVMAGTAINRLDEMPAPNLVIIDEAHLACGDTYMQLIEHWKAQGAYIIYLTATPWRLDGTGLEKIADSMVLSKPIDWLIENKFISEFRYFAPFTADFTGVDKVGGDYVKSQAGDVMEKPAIIGNVIETYKKYCSGMRTVAFCCSIAHSKLMRDQFNSAGIPSAHMDASTPDAERKRIINDLADNKILALFNYAIVTTGFDLSAQVGRNVTVDVALLLRPTMSLSLYLQMCGRVLRAKNYPALIFDFCGLAMRDGEVNHGLPDAPRIWTLEGRVKNKKPKEEPDVLCRQCDQCYCCHKPAPICPECGYIYPIVERKIDEKEGELVEVTAEMIQKKRDRMEQGRAQTVEELVKLGKPRRMAVKIVQAREEKRRLQVEVFDICQIYNPVPGYKIQRLKPKPMKLLIEEFERGGFNAHVIVKMIEGIKC